jgi:hypothetical protein
MNPCKLAVFCTVVLVAVTALGQQPLGDTSWNFRANGDDRFDSNEAWVRPWESGRPQPPWPAPSGAPSGVWVGNYSYTIPWAGVSKRAGGSFNYGASRDHQFHAWTYLYVKEAKTITLSGGGDCVPSAFLNGDFDNRRDGWNQNLALNAGWNRVDLTGYNQNDSYNAATNDLAALADYMDSSARSWDFGDAPASYGTLWANDGARHVISGGLYLGSSIDEEFEGQPHAAARGDDNDRLADEDGVTFPVRLTPGSLAELSVVASAPGKLSAWIDYDNDGSWLGSNEQVFANQPLVAGTNSVSLLVPADIVHPLSTFARFRFSSDSGLSPLGPASDGEVEDYALRIVPRNSAWFQAGTDALGGVNGGSREIGGVDILFEEVTSEGFLTGEYLGVDPGDLPPEFDFLLRPGNPLQVWDFEFEGTFSGLVELTFCSDESLLLGLEDQLKVFHLKPSGQLERLPVLAQDVDANTITVQTNSFSKIAVSPIPEPSTFVLSLAALGVLALSWCWCRQHLGAAH